MSKWYQDDKGSVSAGRIMAVPGFYFGCAVVAASVVAMFMGNAQAAVMAGIGSGISLAALGTKAVSKKMEAAG